MKEKSSLHTMTRSKAGRKHVGASRAMKVAGMLLLPMMLAAVVACDTGGPASGPAATPTAAKPYALVPEGKPPGLSAPVPDPKEALETKPAGQLPDFLSQADAAQRAEIAALYTGAVNNYDAYSHIPCFCGCAIYTHAHMSLAQCFIKNKTADGQVTFTDHSLTCDLCQGAAKLTVDGLANNTPLKDIRAAVFKKLSYTGIWTDTPAP
jgi:hypothetical protein